MAATILLAVILCFTYAARAKRGRSTLYSPRRDGVSGALSAALREAEMINGYSPALQEEPNVHLRPIARITPVKYQDAINEIPANFTQGRVVQLILQA
jgi:hypothetical protein